MNANEGTTPRGFVHPQDRGVNGLPEVESVGEETFEAYGDVVKGIEYPRLERSRSVTASRSDYFTWIAVGAVAVGLVGAVVGCMRQFSRRRHVLWPHAPNSLDSHDVTPPHGDKLMPRG
jgi:hypothetical protein